MYLVDYQLYQSDFSSYCISFLCNRLASHVVHDCAINTSNVECPGETCCIRGGNAIIGASST